MSDEVARDVGEIKGLLQGIRDLVAAGQEATNNRIGDMQASAQQMHAANSRRLDDLADTMRVRLDEHSGALREVRDKANAAHTLASSNVEAIESMRRSATIHGAGAGSIIAAGIELAKHFLKI